MTVCSQCRHDVDYHFPDVGCMVDLDEGVVCDCPVGFE